MAKNTEPDYKLLFQELPGRYIVFLPNDPDFTFVDVSDAYLQLVKARREDIIGKPFFDVLPDISAEHLESGVSKLKESMRRVIRTKKPDTLNTFRYDVPDNAGKIIEHYWQPTHYPILDNNGSIKYIIQRSHEVTEEFIAQAKLRRAQEHLERALSVGLIGTWSWDVQKDIFVGDKNLARMFGLNPAKVAKGLPVSVAIKNIYPDDQKRIEAKIAESVATGGKYEEEYRTITKDGSIRWVFARGSVIKDKRGVSTSFPGVIVDITDRKEAEIALATHSERASTMSDSLPIMLFTASPEGDIIYFNKQWVRYTGLKFKLGHNSRWLDVIHPNDVDETVLLWNKSIAAGEPFEIEVRLRRHDGSYRWHLSRANPIRDETGAIIIWFGSNTDIDDWRRASNRKERLEHITKALKEQRKELVALNRTKDEFISVASHQLRTPATAVKQYLGMMLEGYVGRLTKAQYDAMKTAYDSNERQLETVNDLLRVAQADSGKLVLHKESTDMIALLQAIVDEQKSKFKLKKQQLVFKHRAKRATVVIDKARLRMVIENLVDNANKYTYEEKKITVSCTTTANCITVTVQDEGVGIDTDYLPKLFHKFSRIDNPLSTQAGGTGLGLYWAQKIVALHEGTLKVESEAGKGTTFSVNLPRQ